MKRLILIVAVWGMLAAVPAATHVAQAHPRGYYYRYRPGFYRWGPPVYRVYRPPVVYRPFYPRYYYGAPRVWVGPPAFGYYGPGVSIGIGYW